MRDLLIDCYYDGMTLNAALDFISRNYGSVSNKTIVSAVASIKDCTGIDWSMEDII